MLYSSGAFGCNSPQALINTVWYNNCLHFGLRGGKEQRDLKWGDVFLKKDTEGKEYLEYNTERQTKTRTGENPMNRRSVKPRMYENLSAGPERNPVFLYKLYKAKRPESYMDNNAPFYLGVNHSNASKADLPTLKWFKPQPIGCKQIKFPHERLCTTGWNWKRQANNKSQRSKNTSSKTTRQQYSSNPNRTNNRPQKFAVS